MSWEIVLGLITLASFLFAFGGIIFKASKVMTSLEVAVKALNESMKDSKSDRKGLHAKVDDHETRINILEIKVDNRSNN